MKRYVLKKRKNFNQIIIFDLINKKVYGIWYSCRWHARLSCPRFRCIYIYIHNNLLERISPSTSGPTEGFVSANCQQRSGPISSASLITRNEFFSLLWPVRFSRLATHYNRTRYDTTEVQHSSRSNTNSSYLDHEKIIDRGRASLLKHYTALEEISRGSKKHFQRNARSMYRLSLCIKPSFNATKNKSANK